MLSRPAVDIKVEEVINILGGHFFSAKFCERHSGKKENCAHAVDCSLRVLWNTIQGVLTDVLGRTTLADLLCNEEEMGSMLSNRGPLVALDSTPAAAPRYIVP